MAINYTLDEFHHPLDAEVTACCTPVAARVLRDLHEHTFATGADVAGRTGLTEKAASATLTSLHGRGLLVKQGDAAPYSYRINIIRWDQVRNHMGFGFLDAVRRDEEAKKEAACATTTSKPRSTKSAKRW